MKNLLYKTRLVILFLALFSVSCSKKSEIESIFIANDNEYWAFNNYCTDTRGIYFHFNKNGSTNKYYLHIDDGFTLYDNYNRPVLWSLKNDSVFIYNFSEYKIEEINNKEILLSYNDKKQSKKCFVKLLKWIDGPDGPKPLDSVKVK